MPHPLNCVRYDFRHLVFCAAVIACLLTASCVSLAPSDVSEFVGKPAPGFSLKSLDDQPVNLSDLKGCVVVLDFWATWCPSCRESLPHLQRLSEDKALAGKGLRVIAVDCDEPKEAATEYLAKNKLSLGVVLDEDGSLENDYRIHGLPVTVIIGRDGAIKKVFDGPAAEAELDAVILSAL